MSGAEKQLVMVTIVGGFHEKAKAIQIKTQKRKAEVFTGFRIQNHWHNFHSYFTFFLCFSNQMYSCNQKPAVVGRLLTKILHCSLIFV